MLDPDSDVFAAQLQRSADSTGAASGVRAKGQKTEEKIVSDKLRHVYVWPTGAGTLIGRLISGNQENFLIV